MATAALVFPCRFPGALQRAEDAASPLRPGGTGFRPVLARWPGDREQRPESGGAAPLAVQNPCRSHRTEPLCRALCRCWTGTAAAMPSASRPRRRHRQRRRHQQPDLLRQREDGHQGRQPRHHLAFLLTHTAPASSREGRRIDSGPGRRPPTRPAAPPCAASSKRRAAPVFAHRGRFLGRSTVEGSTTR